MRVGLIFPQWRFDAMMEEATRILDNTQIRLEFIQLADRAALFLDRDVPTLGAGVKDLEAAAKSVNATWGGEYPFVVQTAAGQKFLTEREYALHLEECLERANQALAPLPEQ